MTDELTFITFQAVTYRKDGFASEAEARQAIDRKFAECVGYTLVKSCITETSEDGWEAYFLAQKVVAPRH